MAKPAAEVRGSLGAVVRDYLASGEFREKRPRTQTMYRSVLEPLAKEHGGQLTTAEKRELKQIKETLGAQLSAPGETYDEMVRQQDTADYVDRTLKRLKNGET